MPRALAHKSKYSLLSSLGLLVVLSVSSGCASLAYESTKTGTLTGKLQVRWIQPDRFIYLPDATDPLRFVTSDQRPIQPGVMYTDGGSIPRLLWSVPGFSPWGYGPAYIVHDWLFAAKHCADPAYAWVTFDDSARALGESIKTLMEQDIAPKSPALLYLIVEAVKTPIARDLWDHGACTVPPPGAVQDDIGAAPVIMTIDMSRPLRR